MEKLVREKLLRLNLLLALAVVIAPAFACNGSSGDRADTLAPVPPAIVERTLLKLSDPQDYEGLVQQLTASGMREPCAAYWAGVTALSSGDHNVAHSYFEYVLSSEVQEQFRISARMGIGDVRYAQGSYVEAFATYEEILPRTTAHARFLCLARICAASWRIGQRDTAERWLAVIRTEYRTLGEYFPDCDSVAARLDMNVLRNQRFGLQLGYFRRKTHADALVQRMEEEGFAVRTKVSEGGFRVFLGPFEGRQTAKRAAEKVRKTGHDCFLRPWDELE
ncbi:MAG: SPOR domain-containing protein [Planctomycetota bacterium]|nr:SPOR domain-containing protein [Planctomycetota bacterium]